MQRSIRPFAWAFGLACLVILAVAPAFASEPVPALETPVPSLETLLAEAPSSSAISVASNPFGECLISCGSPPGILVGGLTKEQCCSEPHICPDGSTGYGRAFYPYQGFATRCGI